ncbi:hypothetical protein BC567DRAFT_222350, partial [Phyllosticta citribraziliensis]
MANPNTAAVVDIASPAVDLLAASAVETTKANPAILIAARTTVADPLAASAVDPLVVLAIKTSTADLVAVVAMAAVMEVDIKSRGPPLAPGVVGRL